MCMLLWEQCEEKNVPDIFGRTPLHYSAKHGHLDVYNFILAKVDDKKPLDNEGHTPIALAKSSKCPCHDRKFAERQQCKKAAWEYQVNYFLFQAIINYGNLMAKY